MATKARYNPGDPLDEAELAASNIRLVTQVWHLLHKFNAMKDGKYTFPDGETWTDEDFARWVDYWEMLR